MSELNEILNGNAKSVAGAIVKGANNGDFNLDVLRQLNELESQGQKRQGVLTALAKSMDALVVNDSAAGPDPDPATENTSSEQSELLDQDNPESTDQADPDADPDESEEAPADESGKAARGEIPDWQKSDYNGPLTCEKAEWRNKNITTK